MPKSIGRGVIFAIISGPQGLASFGTCPTHAPVRPSTLVGVGPLETDILALGPFAIFENQAKPETENDDTARPWYRTDQR